MKERPILFSAPMVRAILAGTKTQTRRVWKMPRGCGWYDELGGEHEGWFVDHGQPWWLHVRECRCPYGAPGDLLWVREAWRVRGGREYEYQQDLSQVMYRATHEEDGFPLGWESYKWRPSIHMPRWASRITLRVTDVRVERLQDISEADAIAEGIVSRRISTGDARTGCRDAFGLACDDNAWASSAVHAYQALWEQINGPGSWDANPWVWAVAFERV